MRDQEDLGDYGNTKKHLVFAHEAQDSLIMEELDFEADAKEYDKVFEAYEGQVLDNENAD